ncbi:MAG TPA: hypothetical protein VGM03_00745 [Phycisphaerae bacterium]|jgi:hypothetical protein
MYIDQSVYPDLAEPPAVLETIEDQADYMQRICAAWDFHVHPEPQTFELFKMWKEVFDRFPLPASPAYHAFRQWFGWEPMPMPPGILGPLPLYVQLDRLEERGEDPCEHMI